MVNRDELVKQTVVRLQAIHTLDDFKAARQEIIDLMEKVIHSAIDALKAFFENMLSMTQEEQQAGSAQFQDENYLLSSEIMQELDRLAALPDAGAYAESFSAELEKRIGPHMEEFVVQSGKLMETFMGGLAGVMAGALGATTEEEKAEDAFVFDENDPNTPAMLYDLYTARTLAELEANKKNVMDIVAEQLQFDIGTLEVLMDTPSEESREDDQRRIAEIRNRAERLVPEMDKEFARIAALPDAAEAAGKIKKEMMDLFADKVKELNAKLTNDKARQVW
ncbi:MAG TPA: hypothetical protein VN604_06935 [Nitrospirota bacterium]|nr:hypothetical protein [Nitrospirota bacterium]